MPRRRRFYRHRREDPRDRYYSEIVYDRDYGPADFARYPDTPEEAYWPYGRDFFRYGAPVPGAGIYPEHHWGGGVFYGLEGAGYAPFGLIHFEGYGDEYRRREGARRPERRGRRRHRR